MMRLLVIDDDEYIARITCMQLRNYNIICDYFVINRTTRLLCLLNIIDSSKYNYILSDIEMPYIDGLCIYQNIKNLKNINILFYTANTFSEKAKNLNSYSNVNILEKPLNIKRFINIINK